METLPLVAAVSPPEKPPELACTLIAIGSARAVAGSSSTLSARIGQSLLIDSPASLTSTRRVPRAGLVSATGGARALIRRKGRSRVLKKTKNGAALPRRQSARSPTGAARLVRLHAVRAAPWTRIRPQPQRGRMPSPSPPQD